MAGFQESTPGAERSIFGNPKGGVLQEKEQKGKPHKGKLGVISNEGGIALKRENAAKRFPELTRDSEETVFNWVAATVKENGGLKKGRPENKRLHEVKHLPPNRNEKNHFAKPYQKMKASKHRDQDQITASREKDHGTCPFVRTEYDLENCLQGERRGSASPRWSQREGLKGIKRSKERMKTERDEDARGRGGGKHRVGFEGGD